MSWFKHPTQVVINTNNGATGLAQLRDAWVIWEADANVHWQIASYQSTAPAYLVLKRKDASAGRIMFTGGSTIHSNYAGYNETTNTTQVYMVYDFTATSDAPSANYNTGTAALFGTPSDIRGRFRAVPNGTGSYWFALYCHDTADLTVMWAGNGGQQAIGFMWGKPYKADNGTTPLGYCAMGFTGMTGATYVVPASQGYANGYTTNLATGSSMWVLDTAANEGSVTAVHLVLNATNLSGSGMPWGGQTSDVNANTQFNRPDGTRFFLPVMMSVQCVGAMARPSFVGLQSRYWGIGARGVLDTVWTDNTATVQGYYLGSNTIAANEGVGLSLLNTSF